MTQVLLLNYISLSLITVSVIDDDQIYIYTVHEVSPFIMLLATLSALCKNEKST